MDKGKIVWKPSRKWTIAVEILFTCLFLLFLFGAIYSLLVALGEIPLKYESVQVRVLFGVIFTPFLIFIMIYTLTPDLSLMIYEEGILIIKHPITKAIRRKEKFLPYSEIVSIYPNENFNLKYIVIITNKKPIQIIKRVLGNINVFCESLPKNVIIIKDKDWSMLAGGEVLPRPERIEITKEGVRFICPKIEKFVSWEDIKKIKTVIPWTITHKDDTKTVFYELHENFKEQNKISREIWRGYKEYMRLHINKNH